MHFYIKYTEISVVKCNLNTDPCNQRKQPHPTISPEIVPSLVNIYSIIWVYKCWNIQSIFRKKRFIIAFLCYRNNTVNSLFTKLSEFTYLKKHCNLT